MGLQRQQAMQAHCSPDLFVITFGGLPEALTEKRMNIAIVGKDTSFNILTANEVKNELSFFTTVERR
ncbi:hypothetical protein PRIPAC_70813 [Pristionchus pacificus]|uniref:Uncharacterized protein n=1 Tax=Pristionchus pacificus TaxID=54126 RepID=A0A2A6B4H5_PRIPA|nr:hypothetical protein PRIPAC_70813 [Pristionchus pacificus]|eukprot:PDM60772.1 hypothetical protein PRIPAC_54578 [Pristionchus pacificus]